MSPGRPGSRAATTRPRRRYESTASSALDPTRILSRRELATVLADVKRTAPRSANARRNLIVVRLACCCGLRVSEIAGLQLDDVVVDVARPHLRLRRETTKGKKPRMVPLWWDAGTLADLVAWKAERVGARSAWPRPIRLQRPGASSRPRLAARCHPAPVLDGLQDPRFGPGAHAYHSPRAAHFYIPRACRRAFTRRGQSRSWS